jgi:phosphoglycolate phosphatase-like HAD superfamily hydrolase
MYPKRSGRAVILDLDGTLVDSNTAHARAWLDAFHEAGFTEVSFDLVRPLIGMGADGLLPRAIGVRRDSELGHRVSERRAHLFTKYYLPGITPFAGIRALLVRMRRHGLRLILASSGNEEQTSSILSMSGVGDLLDDVVSRSDVMHTKPDEELMEVALARCGCARDAVLALGDTPYDVEAASRAGVDIVALRCGGWSDAALSAAVRIYDDPKDLLQNFPTSPFASLTSVEYLTERSLWIEPHRAHRV